MRTAQHFDQIDQRRADFAAIDHHIDHAVFAQIFGALESFGQTGANRLFNHARARKTD